VIETISALGLLYLAYSTDAINRRIAAIQEGQRQILAAEAAPAFQGNVVFHERDGSTGRSSEEVSFDNSGSQISDARICFTNVVQVTVDSLTPYLFRLSRDSIDRTGAGTGRLLTEAVPVNPRKLEEEIGDAVSRQFRDKSYSTLHARMWHLISISYSDRLEVKHIRYFNVFEGGVTEIAKKDMSRLVHDIFDFVDPTRPINASSLKLVRAPVAVGITFGRMRDEQYFECSSEELDIFR
jgi:hypothetical protein